MELAGPPTKPVGGTTGQLCYNKIPSFFSGFDFGISIMCIQFSGSGVGWVYSRQCVFLTKFLQVFDIGHAKTCTYKKKVACQSTRTISNLTCNVRLVKEKKHHTSIGTSRIEMTRITEHVTLRWWHFRRKCRCQLTFVLFYF